MAKFNVKFRPPGLPGLAAYWRWNLVEFSADLVGINWLNLTLNLTLNLGPRGFLGRPRLGGGI